ncbi:17751_t:CDS:2 [Funneliformis geosporum]|uniref:204_t:CDS:1 n=1 Tax=Funneliformis geosporum TaxID=1117311 RepID=A0A9W4WXV5_9GLOM|nr:17751_t:CDS:2 [Funneliformis geosporum]CAI2180366.1 204_t:CDS:2 [Funneliformis geosporum]
MKSFISFAIIFCLLVSLTQGYIVSIINNKIDDIVTTVTAFKPVQEGIIRIIDKKSATSPKNYSLNITESIDSYLLEFEAGALGGINIQGPISNDKDECWEFYGTAYDWFVNEC